MQDRIFKECNKLTWCYGTLNNKRLKQGSKRFDKHNKLIVEKTKLGDLNIKDKELNII